jgi:cytidine deaminase
VDSDTIFPPCGACRQVISEFAPRIPVIFGNALRHEITDAATLLPSAFSLDK